LILLGACASTPFPVPAPLFGQPGTPWTVPPPCSALEDRVEPESEVTSWESLVRRTDVTNWSNGVCSSLEKSLLPISQVPLLSRQAIRDECEEKALTLPESVRTSCRAACAARRWLEARTLARQKAIQTLEWFKEKPEEFVHVIERCDVKQGRRLSNDEIQKVLVCAGRTPLPVQLSFRFAAEPADPLPSFGPIPGVPPPGVPPPIQGYWLEVVDNDPNQPWGAIVTTCRNGCFLDRALIHLR